MTVPTGGGFRIGVGGLKELRRDLRAIDQDLPRLVLPRAARAAAEVVLPVAEQHSPVGATGRLARSHRILASQRRAAVAAGGGDAFYGPALHQGTGPRRQLTTGRATGALKANPWLERALAAVGEVRIIDAYDREMTGLLQRYGLA